MPETQWFPQDFLRQISLWGWETWLCIAETAVYLTLSSLSLLPCDSILSEHLTPSSKGRLHFFTSLSRMVIWMFYNQWMKVYRNFCMKPVASNPWSSWTIMGHFGPNPWGQHSRSLLSVTQKEPEPVVAFRIPSTIPSNF